MDQRAVLMLLLLPLWMITAIQPNGPLDFYTLPPSPVSPGDGVTFNCYTGDDPVEMCLYKEEQLIVTRKRENLHKMLKGQPGKEKTYFKFRIDPVSVDDVGSYTCKSLYGEGVPDRITAYRLEVYRPPSDPIVNETLLNIQKGSWLSLTCHITDRGFPLADVFWYKVGHPDFLQQRAIASYNVTFVADQDHGVYYCKAGSTSGYSKESQNITVNVVWSPSGASITTPPSSISIGESLTLTCNLRVWGFPIEEVLWYKATNTDKALYRSSNGRLVVSNISHVDQAGPYYCVGANAYGNTTSEKVTVPVKTPLTVEAGPSQWAILHPMFNKERFILNITVSGTDIGEPYLNYGESYKRLRSSDYITITDVPGHFSYGQKTARVYTIRIKVKQDCDNVTYMDGRYQFTVSKASGWGNWQDQLQVVFFIKLQYPALWKDGPDDIPAVLGDRNVALTCDVCANPSAALIWTMNKQPLPIDIIVNQSGARITIPEVKEQHVGVYACTASNVIDGQEHQKTFQVKFLTNETLNRQQDQEDTAGGPPYIYIVTAGLVALLLSGLIGFAVLRYQRSKDSNEHEAVTTDMTEISSSRDYVTSRTSSGPQGHRRQTHDVSVHSDPTPPLSAGQPPVAAASSSVDRRAENNALTDIYAKPMKKKPPVKEPASDGSGREKREQGKDDAQEMIYAEPMIKRQPAFKIVDDGVLYSEMSFKVPDTHDPTAVPYIHGAEDRVDYASVDWDKMK